MTKALSWGTRADLLDSALPGLVLVAIITGAAFGLRHIPLFAPLSPMILAILIGMLFKNIIGTQERTQSGIALSGKRLLRLSVALLGLQLTFAQIAEIGVRGVGIAAAALVSTFIFTILVGKLMGVDRRLCELLAAGTSICGASAIAATNAVTQAQDEDVSYAIACITLFGTAAMFLYPVFKSALGLDPTAYGIWTGASVHEVAQVVGAAFQGGDAAGQTGVVTKLTRVMMLAPLIVAIAFFATGRERGANAGPRPPLVPMFVIGFIVLMVANSFELVPEAPKSFIVAATPVLLTAALGALGLGTDFAKLRVRGVRPLALAGMSTAFIAIVSLLMVILSA